MNVIKSTVKENGSEYREAFKANPIESIRTRSRKDRKMRAPQLPVRCLGESITKTDYVKHNILPSKSAKPTQTALKGQKMMIAQTTTASTFTKLDLTLSRRTPATGRGSKEITALDKKGASRFYSKVTSREDFTGESFGSAESAKPRTRPIPNNTFEGQTAYTQNFDRKELPIKLSKHRGGAKETRRDQRFVQEKSSYGMDFELENY